MNDAEGESMKHTQPLWSGRASAHQMRPASLVEQCLRHGVEPPASGASCLPAWSTGCLRSSIPAWSTPYSRIGACFRCCMLEAGRACQVRVRYWSAALNRSYTLRHGIPLVESVLIGHNSDLRFAEVGAVYDKEVTGSTGHILGACEDRGRSLDFFATATGAREPARSQR